MSFVHRLEHDPRTGAAWDYSTRSRWLDNSRDDVFEIAGVSLTAD